MQALQGNLLDMARDGNPMCTTLQCPYPQCSDSWMKTRKIFKNIDVTWVWFYKYQIPYVRVGQIQPCQYNVMWLNEILKEETYLFDQTGRPSSPWLWHTRKPAAYFSVRLYFVIHICIKNKINCMVKQINQPKEEPISLLSNIKLIWYSQ